MNGLAGSMLGLSNTSHRWPINPRHETGIINRREGLKHSSSKAAAIWARGPYALYVSTA